MTYLDRLSFIDPGLGNHTQVCAQPSLIRPSLRGLVGWPETVVCEEASGEGQHLGRGHCGRWDSSAGGKAAQSWKLLGQMLSGEMKSAWWRVVGEPES